MYKTEEELIELQRLYDAGELQPTRKEKLIINPKVAYEVTSEDIVKSIPLEYLDKNIDKYGKINRFSLITPTENMLWDFLFFRDISYFRPAAIAYEESERNMKSTKQRARYTHHPKGSRQWYEFWMLEGKRIIEGYEPVIDGKPCGLRIPGELYFYLNYGRLKKAVRDSTGNVIDDKVGFPDFLAMDYYYMKELEARENPSLYGLPLDYKQSLTVVKSRRLGFSYKASLGAMYKTTFDRNNLVIISSGEGSDAKTCFLKSLELRDFISNTTPFGLEDIGEAKHNGGWIHNRDSDTEFSYTIKSTRTPERLGRKSTIKVVSLFQKDDAISGEGLSRLYFEEAGKIINLNAAWGFAMPAMKVGQLYRDGIAIIFGTGGEMVTHTGKKGSSEGLSKLFYAPESQGIAGFDNIYDYSSTENKCGLFFGAMWFYPSPQILINGKNYLTIDRNGNPFFWVAEIVINIERAEKLKNGMKKSEYEQLLTQYCKTPSEAFLVTKGSRFQVEDLVARKTEIEISKGGYDTFRMPGELTEVDNKVEFMPKPDLQPITPNNITGKDREGCLLRYRAPLTMKDKKTGKLIIPNDAYIISVDPIGINTAGGDSLIAVIVFNSGKYPELGEEGIVATYYGRPKITPVDYMCRLLMKLSKYYNAKITFENDKGGDAIFAYFLKSNALDRLLPMPNLVTSTNIKNSKTTLRSFGHAMASPKHKDMGESYIYEWLDKRNHESVLYDTETGEQIKIPSVRNLDRLQDEMLIHQLIQYDRNGNYDAVSAFMGIMLQMQEIYEVEKAFNASGSRDYRTEQIELVFNKLFGSSNYR